MTPGTEEVRVERDGRAMTITLDRPGDQNRLTRDVLLTLQGHDVRVFYDGVPAVQSMIADPPEIAFVDIGMPGIDGYEVARLVRNAHPADITLVALTGWGSEKDRTSSAEAGFDHHMVKPATLESLLSLFSSRKDKTLD